jgi:MFS family permease
VSEREPAGAWLRLFLAVTLATFGGVGFWSIVVALPAVEKAFAVSRADASLAYTATMIGFAGGGILMGRLADRFGIVVPAVGGAASLGLGYLAAGAAPNLAVFTLAQGVLIGVGSAATFAPLIADVSLWFTRRRGIAIAVCASGNYLAGALWPTLLQHLIDTAGWRQMHEALGLFCLATMLPLAFLLRRPPHFRHGQAGALPSGQGAAAALGLAPARLQAVLIAAGICCCVAMSMPQVHLVAYCGDLGYGPARGAEMLSLMLGFGIVSRIAFGFVADRIGGLATLLLGSALQGLALALYLFFDGLGALFVISALFGLFQGGLVPSYAVVVREYFPPREAGMRTGLVMMATLFGMALGGWMSGAIFDLTGSYRAAFLNGVLWNAANAALAMWLLLRARQRLAFA